MTNKKNEPVINASVTLNGTQGGTKTSVDGTFTLTLSTDKKYTITISSVGYAAKELSDVEVKAGQVTDLEVVLDESSKNKLQDVVLRAPARRETTNAMIAFQKNTATVAQVVSAEAIRRSPDKNTGEVLKRVPGTSIQEGKYLVVRGLSDRYNQAMLNGTLLSSTEPDRKTFSFDIFPSAMVDNIIINKAFVPELPGEWAGGLVQVNTKDIPAAPFFTIQVGTGFNTQTIGKDFYTYKGGKIDWLGIDDGSRALPSGFPLKTAFHQLSPEEKTAWGKQFENVWSADKTSSQVVPLLNRSFQLSGGFNKRIGKNNKLGAILALTYNESNRNLQYNNSIYGSFENNQASISFDYKNNKYSQDVLWGALGNITLQLGSNHKISFKNILNINTTDYVIRRTGKDFENDPINGENIRASEYAFKANTFFNTQLSGDHNFSKYGAKLHWYGSFNILDQYVPDQRRIQYNQDPGNASNPYLLLVSASQTSQKSGSRFYGFLNDYIYNAGGDLSKNFNLFKRTQTVKAGYMFQVKDRLFDSRPFSIYLPSGFNAALQQLPESQVFNPENFGPGKFYFNEIFDSKYRYIANTILNAAFLQFDNQFGEKVRVVWGMRWENFDQLIGSVKTTDPRHVRNIKDDFLPGVNLTYKLDTKTNLRLTGSQTVIRPEFRELSPFAFFDFELGATVTGNKELSRTKVTNLDLRYEIYPKAGELLTVGVFYKYFNKPIELYFNQTGAGSSSTFNYINADKAEGYGAELEIRKKLDFIQGMKNFTIQGNVSYIYNRVRRDNAQLNRPMQGQSPYLINLSLQYDVEKIGLNTTLLFNQIGRRILYVGGLEYPPVWEAPRPLVDLQIAKKVFKSKGEIRLNISDIFNKRAYFYHDLNENNKFDKNTKDAIAINRQYGTNVGLTFAYTIK